MTNVRLFSDLHLEFDDPKNPFHPGEGEVLILAGDICTAKHIDKNTPRGEMYRTFFQNCVKGYEKVLYVMGNHEHYGFNFSNTVQRLKENLPEEIHLMNRDVVTHKGWNFMGSTLWTNFANQNPLAMQLAMTTMNDYRSIRFGDTYRKLLPQDILREHNMTRHWMEETLFNLDGPVFMITHHQPSFEGLSEEYRGAATNPFYATELSNFIIRYPQIKFWAAGHTHVSLDYPIEKCRVICNPRGYVGPWLNANFDSNFSVDLPS